MVINKKRIYIFTQRVHLDLASFPKKLRRIKKNLTYSLFLIKSVFAVDQGLIENARIEWHDSLHFNVYLPANSTTGFTWHFLANKSETFVKLVEYDYNPPQIKRAGAGGNAVFSFKTPLCDTREKKYFTLAFIYKRLFEKNKERVHILEVSCPLILEKRSKLPESEK